MRWMGEHRSSAISSFGCVLSLCCSLPFDGRGPHFQLLAGVYLLEVLSAPLIFQPLCPPHLSASPDRPLFASLLRLGGADPCTRPCLPVFTALPSLGCSAPPSLTPIFQSCWAQILPELLRCPLPSRSRLFTAWRELCVSSASMTLDACLSFGIFISCILFSCVWPP